MNLKIPDVFSKSNQPRQTACLASLLGSYNMLEQLKDLCQDDTDTGCVEKRERVAREITEVSSDEDKQVETVICCRQ